MNLDPKNYRVIRATLNGKQISFVVTGPPARDYPDFIKEKDQLYYFSGKPDTFQEAIENMAYLINNKVLPNQKDHYFDKCVDELRRLCYD